MPNPTNIAPLQNFCLSLIIPLYKVFCHSSQLQVWLAKPPQRRTPPLGGLHISSLPRTSTLSGLSFQVKRCWFFSFPLTVRDGKLPLGSVHSALFFLPPLLSPVIKTERKNWTCYFLNRYLKFKVEKKKLWNLSDQWFDTYYLAGSKYSGVRT